MSAFQCQRLLEALERTLQLRGTGLSEDDRQHLTHATDAGLSFLAIALHHACPWARLVTVTATEAARLSFPTLLVDSAGEPLVLLKRGVAAYQVERAGMPGRLSLSLAQGWAVDFGVAIHESGGLLRRLSATVWATRRRYALALGLTTAIVGLAVLPALALRHLLEVSLPAAEERTLLAVVILLCAIGAQRAALITIRARSLNCARAVLEVAGSRAVFREFLRQPWSADATVGAAHRVQSLRAAAAVARVFSDHGSALLLECFAALLFALVLAVAAPVLTAVVVTLAFGAGAVTLYLASRQSPLQEAELRETERQQRHLYELLQGAETFRANGALPRAVARWCRYLVLERGAMYRREMNGARADITAGVFQGLAYISAFSIVGYDALKGVLGAGEVVSAFLLVDGFSRAISNLFIAMVPLARANCYLRHLRPVLIPESAIESRLQGVIEDETFHTSEIRVDHVWFRYSVDSEWTFRDFSLAVAQGQHCLLRAPSGAGKSSLLRLLAGVSHPERGTISVPSPQSETRRRVLYLPQQARLIEGSILENLRVLSGASDDAILVTANASGLAKIVSRLPMGFETRVSPGGENFSGGERQLVLLTAMAAAVERIILLDEPTSHMDRALRDQVDLRSLFKDRTLILASHEDFGSQHLFDRVIDLTQPRANGAQRVTKHAADASVHCTI